MGSNPKKRFGMAKPSLHYVPPCALVYLGVAMREGSEKYGFFNWRETPVDVSTYYSAAMRHWMLFWSGEDKDPKTGVPHLAYAMACAAVVLDAQRAGSLIDDRPHDLGDLQNLIAELTTPFAQPLDQSWANATDMTVDNDLTASTARAAVEEGSRGD